MAQTHPLDADSYCSVVIRPTVAGIFDYLHVNEIQLFSPAGQPVSIAAVSMSTEYKTSTDYFPAANCIDGNVSTTCSTNVNDALASIRVTYVCASGATPPGTRAFITNRPNLESRLHKSSLDFVDASGKVDGGSYPLIGALATVNVTAGAARESLLPSCSAKCTALYCNGRR